MCILSSRKFSFKKKSLLFTENRLCALYIGSCRGGGLNRLVFDDIGLGLLGVAMETADYFMQTSEIAQTGGQPQALPANSLLGPTG